MMTLDITFSACEQQKDERNLADCHIPDSATRPHPQSSTSVDGVCHSLVTIQVHHSCNIYLQQPPSIAKSAVGSAQWLTQADNGNLRWRATWVLSQRSHLSLSVIENGKAAELSKAHSEAMQHTDTADMLQRKVKITEGTSRDTKGCHEKQNEGHSHYRAHCKNEEPDHRPKRSRCGWSHVLKCPFSCLCLATAFFHHFVFYNRLFFT